MKRQSVLTLAFSTHLYFVFVGSRLRLRDSSSSASNIITDFKLQMDNAQGVVDVKGCWRWH